MGRPSVPVDTYLRLMYLKFRYGFGYEVLVDEVSDSILWRHFCRIPLDKKVPDSTTLIRLAKKYGDDTVQKLNDILVAKATKERLTRSRKLRVDTTVIESNIHYPTDSQLLSDGIKTITRKAKQLRKVLGETAVGIIPTVTDRCRSAKNRILKIGKVLKRRSREAVSEVRDITGEILDKAIQTVVETKEMLDKIEDSLSEKINQSAKRRMAQLDKIIETTEKVIGQTLKVNEGNTKIPDRIISLHDPDARPIRKGKLKNPTEFGYKLEITENEDRIITDYKVHIGNPNDDTLLLKAVERHIKKTGVVPRGIATDRGFSGSGNEKGLTELKVKQISIPKRGKKTEQRLKHERQAWFRRLQKWRAGGEGTISVLKRKYGLGRSLSRGHSGVCTWAGFGILTYNLRRLATMN